MDTYEGEDEDIQLIILPLLIRFNYPAAIPKMRDLSETEPLTFLNYLHWYVPEKTLEWEPEIKTIMVEDFKDPGVDIYLEQVTFIDAPSIIK